MADDATQASVLRQLLDSLPSLCAPPDGLFYAGDTAGIERYRQIQARIEDRINQWLEVLEGDT